MSFRLRAVCRDAAFSPPMAIELLFEDEIEVLHSIGDMIREGLACLDPGHGSLYARRGRAGHDASLDEHDEVGLVHGEGGRA